MGFERVERLDQRVLATRKVLTVIYAVFAFCHHPEEQFCSRKHCNQTKMVNDAADEIDAATTNVRRIFSELWHELLIAEFKDWSGFMVGQNCPSQLHRWRILSSRFRSSRERAAASLHIRPISP